MREIRPHAPVLYHLVSWRKALTHHGRSSSVGINHDSSTCSGIILFGLSLLPLFFMVTKLCRCGRSWCVEEEVQVVAGSRKRRNGSQGRHYHQDPLVSPVPPLAASAAVASPHPPTPPLSSFLLYSSLPIFRSITCNHQSSAASESPLCLLLFHWSFLFGLLFHCPSLHYISASKISRNFKRGRKRDSSPKPTKTSAIRFRNTTGQRWKSALVVVLYVPKKTVCNSALASSL